MESSIFYRQPGVIGQPWKAQLLFKYLFLLMFFNYGILNATPPRLVSLTPQATEIIFQLGKGTTVVATSDHNSVAEAKNIPRLGGGITPGLERILRFNPQWVIGNLGAYRPELRRALKAFGIPFFSFNISSLDELFSESSRFLNEVFHETKNSRLEALKRCLNSLKPGPPFPFLAFAWATPPVFFGHRTLLSDLLTRLGGRNALPDWPTPYPQVSEEWIIKRQVSKVFYVSVNSEDAQTAQRNFKHWWPNHTPAPVSLISDIFSHASFSPLLHANKLVRDSLSKECPHE